MSWLPFLRSIILCHSLVPLHVQSYSPFSCWVHGNGTGHIENHSSHCMYCACSSTTTHVEPWWVWIQCVQVGLTWAVSCTYVCIATCVPIAFVVRWEDMLASQLCWKNMYLPTPAGQAYKCKCTGGWTLHLAVSVGFLNLILFPACCFHLPPV